MINYITLSTLPYIVYYYRFVSSKLNKIKHETKKKLNVISLPSILSQAFF